MKGLILLDRDGVINRMIPAPGEPSGWDSPLAPEQVDLLPGAAEALKLLTNAGYTLAICSNQPAAAKGKTTRAALEAVHDAVLKLAQAEGGHIASSHLCFHRAEDGCACRKPKPGLLLEAKARHPGLPALWMAGDRLGDLQAAAAAGIPGALIAPHSSELRQACDDAGVSPAFWGTTLLQFVRERV
jgi:D-glycero-D-manno-heptose 1,7-bisphosphate phosphatase